MMVMMIWVSVLSLLAWVVIGDAAVAVAVADVDVVAAALSDACS